MVKYGSMKPGGMPEEAWEAVIEAWENGLSDREASFRASKYSGVFIKESDIQEMVKGDADIAQLKDFLHADITSQARLNIVDEIRDGNVAISKWYLERKAPEEFSSKAALELAGSVVGVSVEDKQEEMERFLRQYTDE